MIFDTWKIEINAIRKSLIISYVKKIMIIMKLLRASLKINFTDLI
jgi:hypothetical protein